MQEQHTAATAAPSSRKINIDFQQLLIYQKLGGIEGRRWTANLAIRVRSREQGEGNDPNFLGLFLEENKKKNSNFLLPSIFFLLKEKTLYICLLYISNGVSSLN